MRLNTIVYLYTQGFTLRYRNYIPTGFKEMFFTQLTKILKKPHRGNLFILVEESDLGYGYIAKQVLLKFCPY